MSAKHYPLKFVPILKERIWGGGKLARLNKSLDSDSIGESWELSAVPGDVSVVENGLLKGKNLLEVIAVDPIGILGTKVLNASKEDFPLLFKFLDAQQDLSIQVHPNDQLARKRHGSLGKTEMWYILEAEEDSRIIVGFQEKSSPEEYVKALEEKSLPKILKEYKVRPGDVFYLQTGTIHAIGAGIVLAEIQQSSDVTYRVYDWDRTDAEGKQRELHVEQALEAINYDLVDPVINYSKVQNQFVKLIDGKYFITSFLKLNGNYNFNWDDSCFSVIMCLKGSGTIDYDHGQMRFVAGDTILLPAKLSSVNLTGAAELLEIHI